MLSLCHRVYGDTEKQMAHDEKKEKVLRQLGIYKTFYYSHENELYKRQAYRNTGNHCMSQFSRHIYTMTLN